MVKIIEKVWTKQELLTRIRHLKSDIEELNRLDKDTFPLEKQLQNFRRRLGEQSN